MTRVLPFIHPDFISQGTTKYSLRDIFTSGSYLLHVFAFRTSLVDIDKQTSSYPLLLSLHAAIKNERTLCGRLGEVVEVLQIDWWVVGCEWDELSTIYTQGTQLPCTFPPILPSRLSLCVYFKRVRRELQSEMFNSSFGKQAVSRMNYRIWSGSVLQLKMKKGSLLTFTHYLVPLACIQ